MNTEERNKHRARNVIMEREPGGTLLFLRRGVPHLIDSLKVYRFISYLVISRPSTPDIPMVGAVTLNPSRGNQLFQKKKIVERIVFNALNKVTKGLTFLL